MIEKINNNGHTYVDLGLPSRTLWSTCNVGADKPSDPGLYFQWGDTKGYTKEQVGIEKKFEYDFSDYKWYLSGEGSEIKFTKYSSNGDILELEDDAAHVHMGGSWHMPTPAQFKELIDNTISTWATQDGVNGRLFTSKTDTSKSMFIPAVGGVWDGSVHSSGNSGGVWSSMLDAGSASGGQLLVFYSEYAYLDNSDRCDGLPVRGVIG